MKTEKELNEDILEITMMIQKEFPELSKFIGEMQIKTSELARLEITIANLKDYYDSLDYFIKKMRTELNCVTI